jgi:cytochrome P450
MTAPFYHPFDPVQARDPEAALATLRQLCPISRQTREGLPDVVLVTRYHDVSAVFRNYKTFGNMGVKATIKAHDAALARRPTVAELDPPAHTWVRRLLLVAMAPKAIQLATPHIRGVAADTVASFLPAGRVDLITDWGTPIPSNAIAYVLGLPESDWPKINAWVQSQFSDPAFAVADDKGIGRTPEDFYAYLQEHLDRRRAAGASMDDALTRMMQFRRDDGTSFTDAELTQVVRTLLSAGNETTTSLMCNTVYRLLTTRGAMDAVRADRGLVASAIEESLRLDPPVVVFARRVRRPVDLVGVALNPDEVVAASLLSANRDRCVWGDDADEFRVDRFLDATGQPGHLGFGLGVHFCAGAPLARLSARLGLEALLDATSDIQFQDGYRYDKVPFYMLRRPRSLTVTFSPADSAIV